MYNRENQTWNLCGLSYPNVVVMFRASLKWKILSCQDWHLLCGYVDTCINSKFLMYSLCVHAHTLNYSVSLQKGCPSTWIQYRLSCKDVLQTLISHRLCSDFPSSLLDPIGLSKFIVEIHFYYTVHLEKCFMRLVGSEILDSRHQWPAWLMELMFTFVIVSVVNILCWVPLIASF